MTVHTRYTCLCEEFVSIAEPYVDENILQALKHKYAESIDSRRKLSNIKDLKGLIKVLEKRDILSYNDIKPLCHISEQFVNNSYLQNKLSDYTLEVLSIKVFPLYNMYEDDNAACRPLPQTNKTNSKINRRNSIESSIPQPGTCQFSTLPPLSSASQKLQNQCQYHIPNTRFQSEHDTLLQQTVLSQISNRLGRSWRDVARHLGIRECDIDAIQNKYPYDLKEQSYEALKSYISQYGNDNWNLNLMRALEKGRRRDLKEIVEQLTIRANPNTIPVL